MKHPARHAAAYGETGETWRTPSLTRPVDPPPVRETAQAGHDRGPAHDEQCPVLQPRRSPAASLGGALRRQVRRRTRDHVRERG